MTREMALRLEAEAELAALQTKLDALIEAGETVINQIDDRAYREEFRAAIAEAKK
jgi:capsule polysaccharide export protein KpsE/RkpR